MNKELTEIDGKLYDDDMNEVVMEPKKELASIDVPNFGVCFIEGNKYENYFGTYIVLTILASEKKMVVQYTASNGTGVTVGEKKTYPVFAQAETIFKEERRKKSKLRLNNIMSFSGSEHSFVLGLVSANGYISAEIGPSSHKSFPEKYKAVTGEDAGEYDGNGFHLSPNADRWSYTLRVHLPMLADDVLTQMDLKKMHIRSEGIEVNDNSFVWGLFNMGFSIGRNDENIDRIRERLSENEREAFDAGTIAV